MYKCLQFDISIQLKNWAYRQISFAVAAFEAGLVIGNPIRRQQIDEMDSLVACLTFVLGATERHGDSAAKVEYESQEIKHQIK